MQGASGDQQLDLEGRYRFAFLDGWFQACVNDRKRGLRIVKAAYAVGVWFLTSESCFAEFSIEEWLLALGRPRCHPRPAARIKMVDQIQSPSLEGMAS
jgi:hypothetical protein